MIIINFNIFPCKNNFNNTIHQKNNPHKITKNNYRKNKCDNPLTSLLQVENFLKDISQVKKIYNLIKKFSKK